MAQLSYRRHRFPAEIIQHAIWLYLRFTLSYRDVEELLAERGLDVSYDAALGAEIWRRLRDGCASVGLGQAIDGIWTVCHEHISEGGDVRAYRSARRFQTIQTIMIRLRNKAASEES